MGQGVRLSWNTSGWFGAQLGGSLWILIAAAIVTGHDAATSWILLAIFLLPNMAGYLLWRRKSLSCYASMQILFGMIGIFGLLAIYVLHINRLWLEIQKGGAVSAGLASCLLILIVLILLITFYWRFGRNRNGAVT